MPTVTDTIMAAVPADDAGLGSALNDTSREIGFALGVAVLGSIFTAVFRNNVTGSLEDLVPAGVADTVGDSLGSLAVIAGELSPEVASSVVSAANQAFVDAMGVSLIVAIGFVGLSIAISVLALPRRVRQLQAEYAPV